MPFSLCRRREGRTSRSLIRTVLELVKQMQLRFVMQEGGKPVCTSHPAGGPYKLWDIPFWCCCWVQAWALVQPKWGVCLGRSISYLCISAVFLVSVEALCSFQVPGWDLPTRLPWNQHPEQIPISLKWVHREQGWGKRCAPSVKGSGVWGVWVGGASRDLAGEKCRVWVARGSLMGAEMSEWLQGSSGLFALPRAALVSLLVPLRVTGSP